jgi:putative tricarboxylic transport membrane protein
MIRSSEFWGGLFWLAIGGFVVWAGRDLGIGRVNDPGAGFGLFWIGALLVFLSALVVLAALRAPGPSVPSLWADTRWGKVIVVVLLLVAFGFLFDRIGFVVCSTAMLLILMLFIDPVRLWIAIPVALIAPIGVYFVITKWLKIQMPVGILAGYL